MPERGAATELGAVREAMDHAISRALECLITERRLITFRGSSLAVKKAEQQFLLACRDVTNCVDDMAPEKRPKGWSLGPDGATA